MTRLAPHLFSFSLITFPLSSLFHILPERSIRYVMFSWLVVYKLVDLAR